MHNFKIKILIALFIGFLMNGCGNNSNSSSNVEKRLSLNEDNIINTASEEVELDETQFSDGVVTEDVDIIVESEDGATAVETTLAEGTEFKDGKGDSIASPPTLTIVQRESSERVVKNGTVSDVNVVKNELKLVDKNGNSVVPSKPLEIIMKAPVGAKPGDEVKMDIPNGAMTKKGESLDKLIVFIVGQDGNIHIILIPELFKDFTVIVIIIQRITPPLPITGGTGSN